MSNDLNFLLISKDPHAFDPFIKSVRSSMSNCQFKHLTPDNLGFTFPGRFEIVAPYSLSSDIERVYEKSLTDRTYFTTQLSDTYINNGARITIYELCESKQFNHYMVYGKSVYSIVHHIDYTNIDECMTSIVKTEFDETTGLTFSQHLDPWNINYYNSWLCKVRFRVIRRLYLSLNHYCHEIVKQVIPGTEFKFLGQGGSNSAILDTRNNQVLRISEVHREYNPTALKALQQGGKDTGFSPVLHVIDERGIKYIVLPLLKPITHTDKAKMLTCLNKFVSFMSKHKDFLYTDFWHENFLQSIDESTYYVSDLDMETIITEPIDNLDSYNDILNNEKLLKLSYNQPFYQAFCLKHKIQQNGFIFSLIAAALYHLADYNDAIVYTSTVEKKLLSIVQNQHL